MPPSATPPQCPGRWPPRWASPSSRELVCPAASPPPWRAAHDFLFDNCEHVLDAPGELIELILGNSAAVRILTTSREGLRVADEQLKPVPPLDVDTAAAALFVERAHAVAPGNSLNPKANEVAEICRRLDGIPLAIELAASRLQDDHHRGAGPTRRPLPATGGLSSWAGAPPNLATRCAVVLRPA